MTTLATATRPDVDIQFRRIAAELTRRGLFAGAAGTAALWALSACGSGGAAGTDAGAATRTVTTEDGTFVVPRDPQRVVCIDYFTAIFLIELGLVPAGGIDYSWVDDSSMFPEYVPILQQLAGIGEITATNFEKVAALNPDLILGPTPGSLYDNSKGAMAALDSVAPVASVNFGTTGDWRGPFEQTAALVNRSEQLAPLVDSYRAAVDRARKDYADLLAGTVVTVVGYSQDGIIALDLPQSTDGVVLADLGVTFGAASADNGSNSRELSLERLGDLADSDIILYRADASGAPTSGVQDVVTLEGWQSLPAVRAGHAYPIGWADVCTYRWAEAAITDFTSILDKYRDGAA